ncbi:ABC transporter ATP-binding protein [Aquabacterium sp. OR-4]|uniref:ABC transporter ATP-binding protein n=1 Tax=Aquabacterium sp. OR-4 TaxID=2978127 RepID=UPI0028C864C2|nr:ABC transporter ATP-binding protein [Aquabacterium sp. OR-4]MDT7835333.1 ABC transporter ATP-binding protein [Aquabacterium sp. OR-4]
MLTIDQLHVALDAESGIVRAIDGLSLAMRRGETFALVGESGCGKSMTALALLRLLPESGAVTAGEIRLAGAQGGGMQDLLGLPEAAMRRVRGGRVGMIFQEPGTSLNPVLTVGTQMAEAIEAHTGLRGAAVRTKAIDWLRRVGIPEPERRIDDYPFRMSGGQKQRVMIAMTLACEPDFLVADEPTTALDVTIQKQILDLLKDLQREQGMGLLLITHDLAVVAGMAHHVALMYAGQIIEVAPAAQFFAQPQHPYALALLQALPDAQRRGEPLAAIPGTVPLLTQAFAGCRFAPRCAHAQPRCSSEQPQLQAGPAAAGQVRCLLLAPDAQGRVPGLGPAQRPLLTELAVRPPASAASSVPAGAPQGTPHSLTDSAAPAAVAAAANAQAEAAGTSPLLQVRDLHVSFQLGKGLLQRAAPQFHAVRGVSFEVPAGRTLALVGESGCGKTTTGKAIVQLLRGQALVRGEALLQGRNLFDLSGAALREARKAVQIIFQDPFSSLNPRLRVLDILEEGIGALQPEMPAEQRRQRVTTIAEQVGLRREALARFPHEFSGGQRQRIAIARALALSPRLIVCDEPTSALDVSVQAQILNLLRELQRELGVSYLFITHNIGVVEYIADHIAVMQAGRIVEQGSCADVLERPQHAYTQALLAAVPRI